MRPDYLILLLIVFLIVLAWWMFYRKPSVKTKVFPSGWRVILQQKVHFYQQLPVPERDRFEQSILQFFEDVAISGVAIDIDDTDRLLVAASAMIPIFGFPGWRYHNLNEVLLYEGTFNADYETHGADRDILGMVGSGAMQRMMILSRKALHEGFENRQSKSNVGIHEFVHLLDKSDGAVDGIPEVLIEKPFVIPWIKEIHQEIAAIKGQRSDINPYGATNEAEFFSVASEYFFSQPHLFEEKHPELFQLLERVFRQEL